MEIDFKPKYYGSMVRLSVTTVKGGIEYTIHLEDVDAIPIEWIEKFIDNDILSETVKILLNAWYWEKENENN